jgi:acyl-CoA thioester hydrolase
MAEELSLAVRVYWEDTDAGGIVYHAAYLQFMERARTEWLRVRGVDQVALRAHARLQFAVVDMHMQWLRPARFDDLLTVTATLADCGGASGTFRQEVRRLHEVLAQATVRVAALDAETLKPCRLPAAFVE